jgi:hypothetical protein
MEGAFMHHLLCAAYTPALHARLHTRPYTLAADTRRARSWRALWWCSLCGRALRELRAHLPFAC